MMTDTSKPAKPVHHIQDLVIDTQAYKIVKNVLHACKNEEVNHQSILQKELLKCHKKRTSLYTGVPLQIIESITEEPSSYPEIDFSLHLMIRKTLKKFYSKEEEPTCRQLYDILRAQCITDHANRVKLSTDFAVFTHQLIQLGYETVKTIDGGLMIMEIPKHTFERYRYIKKMIKARTLENKIYYLSVRIYDRVKHCMVPINRKFLSKPAYEWDVLTSYHLTSKDGLENIFFSYNYDTDILFKWILQILVPILKPSSLIVIDNNLLGVPEQQYISEYHPKKDMLNWLKNHNLPCTPSMPKAELFKLIEECPVKSKNNTLINVLESFGHDVFCVPDQIHDLTPTQLLWKDINHKLKSQFIQADTIANKIAMKDYICDEISSLRMDIWKKYDQIIKTAEEEFFALDTDIENYLDKYKFDFDSIIPDGNKKWSSIAML